MNVLGIDIGTTSVKVLLVDHITKRCLFTRKLDTNSTIRSYLLHEQDVKKILESIEYCLTLIPDNDMKNVKYVGISGQMHGIMFWNNREYEKDNFMCSQFITWMDQRCDDDFILRLPSMPSNIISEIKVSTGYGCATIFHYLYNEEIFLKKWRSSGNIVDYFVSLLCNNTKPIMSPQMAHSWGYFDIVNNAWFLSELKSKNFPTELLPEIAPTGTVFGSCVSELYRIPREAKILIGMGDLQCSMFGACDENLRAAINFSTSSQFAVRVTRNDLERLNFDKDSKGRLRIIEDLVVNPFIDVDDYLLVAASLNGGNVLEEFVRMLQRWTVDLTGDLLPAEKIWNRLTSSERVTGAGDSCDIFDTDISVVPTLFGERSNPKKKATISGIGPELCSLSEMYNSICYGLVNNLRTMTNEKVIERLGVQKLTCTGGAVNRHNSIKASIDRLYSSYIPIILFKDHYDACMGTVEYIGSLIDKGQLQ